jgi:1,4-dihydroxy-2-naphthoyl-CoA hydrolase
MPVNAHTRQPAGMLQAARRWPSPRRLPRGRQPIASTPASITAGIEINANHVRPMAEGYVYGTARPVSLGKTLQVWEVRISNEQEKLVCISRVTMAVLSVASQY